MKLTKTYGWLRRDFSYDAICEHCGNEEKNISGYDDTNYYENVIPGMKCKKCGESSKSKDSGEVILCNSPRYDSRAVM